MFFKERPNKKELMVSIQCITYNHELYIRQCLEGFVMQKTNFQFEVIVHDDASTDGTAAIIREYTEKYPDIIKPIYETENQYSKHDGSLQHIMNAHTHGKYVALCEGDDYWIDPYKLQKQVDFLETHTEYGMVCTSCKVVNKKSEQLFVKSRKLSVVTLEDLLLDNPINTCTVCIVWKKFLEASYFTEKLKIKTLLMGDLPRWIYIAKNSKIKYMRYYSSSYRMLQNSASHSTDIKKIEMFTKNELDIRVCCAKEFRLPVRTINNIKRRNNQILVRKMNQFGFDFFLKYYCEYIKKYPSAIILDIKTNILLLLTLIRSI